ncbi:retrovirus-related pol polyprotein from transposon TNT 1-94 [Tanacetum coccineum]
MAAGLTFLASALYSSESRVRACPFLIVFLHKWICVFYTYHRSSGRDYDYDSRSPSPVTPSRCEGCGKPKVKNASTRLYVSNLHSYCSGERFYGFVEYQKIEDAAKARHKLHLKSLMGKKIEVDYAHDYAPKKRRVHSGSPPTPSSAESYSLFKGRNPTNTSRYASDLSMGQEIKVDCALDYAPKKRWVHSGSPTPSSAESYSLYKASRYASDSRFGFEVGSLSAKYPSKNFDVDPVKPRIKKCVGCSGYSSGTLAEVPPELPSGACFRYLHRHVPPVSCDQLFSAGDAVIPKFDMHVNPSVLSSDEVSSLVTEYAIPSDLHPCVPPSGLTMNRLPADKIGIYDQYLELSGVKRHQDSSVEDPSPTCVRAEDIRRLCENVIDLRPVHPAMLYVVGLTTIWKHVGHHPVFKDGEENVATRMSQFLKFLMAGGVRVRKGTALAANEVIRQHTTPPLPSGSQIPKKSDHQRVVEVENERVLAAKRKAQIAKDKAVGKKAAEGVSHRTKKRKTTPLSFGLSDSKADESNRSGSSTHHSASPFNTIIPNKDGLATSLILEPVN